MSFKETYFKYYPELVRYGQQLRLEESEMEDLVQETFLRYHLELGKKVIIRNKRAWLYKVFHNLALSSKQSKISHHKKMKQYQMETSASEHFPDLENQERSDLVFSILEKIPENEKNLLLLYHNGLKYKEIARVLDLNPASVGTMLVRAIKKLKHLLKSEYYELFG
jgi:RNA polymerase sigma-70 factor (ECF subfamily)